MNHLLERCFGLQSHGTTLRTEVNAGLTTFLTMAYIIFVNPQILSEAGMDHGAVFVATCLAAAAGCFLMGFLANLPVALAPGMGLNAFFTYGVVLGMGYDWRVALGAVFLSGIIFIFLSLGKIREWLINAIPLSLKQAIAAGIGAFLALVALINAGIIVDNPATLVSLGKMSGLAPLLTFIGFLSITALAYHKIPGAAVIGILGVSLIGLLFDPQVNFRGIASMPPSIMPTLLAMNIKDACTVAMIGVIFAFLFVDLFDTSGTLIAVTQRAGLTDERGNIPRLGQALLADSSATVVGAALGTSTTTSFIESAAGTAVGGRTGLTAVVVGMLFLMALFFSPLAQMIPSYATAGAILYVAVLMMSPLRHIHWDDLTEAAPAVSVLLMTPLTYSIAHGITFGFITYTGVKLISGRGRELNISVSIISFLLLLKLIFID